MDAPVLPPVEAILEPPSNKRRVIQIGIVTAVACVIIGGVAVVLYAINKETQVRPDTLQIHDAPPPSIHQAIFDLMSKGTPLEGHILSGADDDYLDGGEGEDTVTYSGQGSAYALYRGNDVPANNAYNAVLLLDRRSGAIDILVNVERIDFADQIVSLPDLKILSTKVVPVGTATATLRVKERMAVQNETGRTVSVALAGGVSSTSVAVAITFESLVQDVRYVSKDAPITIALGEDANAPRLSISLMSIQNNTATLRLSMLPL